MSIRTRRGHSTTFCLPEELMQFLDERATRHGTSHNAELVQIVGRELDRSSGLGADAKLDELLRTERLIGYDLAKDDLKRFLNEQRLPRAPLGSGMAKLSAAIRTWITTGRLYTQP